VARAVQLRLPALGVETGQDQVRPHRGQRGSLRQAAHHGRGAGGGCGPAEQCLDQAEQFGVLDQRWEHPPQHGYGHEAEAVVEIGAGYPAEAFIAQPGDGLDGVGYSQPWVAGAGFPLVRSSDDLVVLADSRDEAWEAMRVVSEAAADLGMPLGADKSAVMSFEEGFSFIGEDFGPRYPPALADHRVSKPARRVLYLAMQGTHARLDAGRIIVESADDQKLLDVASGTVTRIVSFGAIGISAGLRSWALASDVDLVFLSRRGTYLGHAQAAAGQHRITRLRAQLAAADDTARAIQFGRAVIEAKVRKQMIMLQRLARRGNADTVGGAASQMDHLLTMLPDCQTREELMGIEGAAAREYFGALGQIMPDGMTFNGRSRRPPEDIINAALSYGYAIILSETVSALCAAGLDPAIGLLHADDDTRPSLALDLMEEFRPLIVDQVVIAAARRAELRPEHGHREEAVHGVLLTKAGREVLVAGYERRMLQHTRGALPGLSGSLRRHLYRQAERLAAYVADPSAAWTGLSWR
jgi:CRISPR-associated protein Cas1